MDKILIFGDGQIGNFYLDFFKENKVKASLSKADITKKDEVEDAISKYDPTVVINTAAMTNLEWCEKNRLETFNSNVLGADVVAQACDENDIYFIHFSSGCIFQSKDKNDAKREGDEPDPAAYYAWTKLWSEQLIEFNKSKDFKYLILRPRQPVSAQVNYKNMLLKMLTFKKFIDTPNTGTVIEDLMEWTLEFIKKKPVGVLHVANEGFSTPYKIGLLLRKYVLPEFEFEKITKEELDKIMPNRRVDTILNVDKLKGLGIEVKPYEVRLEEIVKQLGENIRNCDKKKLAEELDKTVAQSKERTVVNDAWKKLLK